MIRLGREETGERGMMEEKRHGQSEMVWQRRPVLPTEQMIMRSCDTGIAPSRGVVRGLTHAGR